MFYYKTSPPKIAAKLAINLKMSKHLLPIFQGVKPF